MAVDTPVTKRVGIIRMVGGSELQGIQMTIDEGFLPASTWSNVVAQIRKENGNLIERQMVLQSETTTEGVYLAELQANDLDAAGEIAQMEVEFFRASDGLKAVLPENGYIEIRARAQV